jgi:hypothetical protein
MQLHKVNQSPATDEQRDNIVADVLLMFEEEGQTELSFVLGHLIVIMKRQGSGDIDVSVGDLTHTATIMTEQSDL